MTNMTSAGVVLVKDERARSLQRPGQNPRLKLCHLPPVANGDGVLADQIHARDVTIEVDAYARPVQARRDLLDMARFAGAVASLHHHAPVVHEAGKQCQRRIAVEDVIRIERRNVFVNRRVGRHLQVGFDPEQVACGDSGVGQAERLGAGLGTVGDGGHAEQSLSQTAWRFLPP